MDDCATPTSERMRRLARVHQVAEIGDALSAQRMHFPTPMLRDIHKYAERLEQSVSWCIRTAWCIASGDLQRTDHMEKIADHRLLRGKRKPEVIELPLTFWFDATLESERLDRSKSWLLQRAWLLARPRFLKALK